VNERRAAASMGCLFREDFVGIGFIIASFGRSGSMTLTISLLEIKEISVFHIPRFITQGRIQAAQHVFFID
jgi:hypothetical protein